MITLNTLLIKEKNIETFDKKRIVENLETAMFYELD